MMRDRLTKAEPHVEKVKDSEALSEEGREQIGERPRKISGQPSEQKTQADQMAEPAAVEEQAKEVPSSDVTVIKVESLMDRFIRHCWWLYGRQRVLLTTGAALVVLLLILVARRQRTELARTVYASPIGGRPPTIGLRLAGGKPSRQGTKDLEKGRLAYVPEGDAKRKKWGKTIKQWKKLGGQIERPQHGTTERKQATEHLKEQTAEVRTAEEKLQHGLMKCGRTEERPKQQADEVSVANEPLQRNKERARTNYKYEDSHRVIGKVKQKLCGKCKKWKAESDFHKNRSCKDGLARWCKECKAKAAREYRRRRTAAKD
jgi:hypothetical protein